MTEYTIQVMNLVVAGVHVLIEHRKLLQDAPPGFRIGVERLGFTVVGSGFRVSGFGFSVRGLGCTVSG